MATLVTQVRSALLRRWFAAHGVRFGPGVQLSAGVRLGRGFAGGRSGTVEVGARTHLQDGVILDAWGGAITVGAEVFLGPYTVIYGHGGVTIGDQTLVSMHCRILSSNHALPPLGVPIRSQPDQRRATRIGRDVWLGAGVTVLAGVTIGEGCVVGAGAVVTGDLPPGAIAVGVPARVVRQRAVS